MKKLLLVLALFAAPALAQEAPAPVDYADGASWLCLPGRPDACAMPLPTADLTPEGYGPVVPARPAADPPIDCFYVYPTVSRDPGLNSDMNAGPEEQGTVSVQLGRFTTVCRPFAPIYRQGTLVSIAAVLQGQNVLPVMAQAYGDVRAAWRHYLAEHNQGRPFVLVGHSQGAVHLMTLLAQEIEGRPEAERMMSAILLGWAVEVPEGAVVGGTFRSTPLCERPGQTGCVISYMTFRADSPPPSGSFLGRAMRPGMTAACTDPSRLAGRDGVLESVWFAAAPPPPGAPAIRWSSAGAPPAPFLRTEGLVSGACAHDGQAGWLALTVHADRADARTDRIPGDVYMAGQRVPGWGTHLIDVNVAQGDLIRIVEAQGAALLAR